MLVKGHARGSARVIVIVLLLLLAGLGGAGAFLYKTKLLAGRGPSKADLPHVNLSEDVIRFSFNILPALYNKMRELNQEINLIHLELSRLESLSSDYPQQKNIINTEKTVWEKTLKSLFTVLQSFEKKIEAIYVAYAVNEEKGKTLIEETTPDLLSAADEVIAVSKAETVRIRIETPKTFTEKLKAKFGK